MTNKEQSVGKMNEVQNLKKKVKVSRKCQPKESRHGCINSKQNTL